MKSVFPLFFGLTALSLFMSYSSGPPAGRTNSPGDAKSCQATGCHADAPLIVNTTSWITTNIPSKGFVKDSTYTITITPGNVAHSVIGFEASAQDITGAPIGTLGVTDAVNTKFADATTKYVEHTKVGTAATVGTQKSWQFSWKATTANTGDSVTFYACVNMTNANSAPSGDSIYFNKTTVRRAFGTPTNDLAASVKVQVSPNPTNISANNTVFSFSKPTVGTWNLRLYTLYGALIASHKIEGSGDIQYRLPVYNIANGMYAYSISDDQDAPRAIGKLVISGE